MHKYTVELRVSGHNVDISGVSRLLRLDPTNSNDQREGRRLAANRRESFWGYDIRPPRAAERNDWDSLETALATALKKFRSKKIALHKLRRQFQVYFWCGHFTSSFDGGPTFSAGLLKRLGDFGVDVMIDTYCSQA